MTSGRSRNKLMNKPLSQVTSLQWWQNHATRALEQELLAQANEDADVVVIVLCVDGTTLQRKTMKGGDMVKLVSQPWCTILDVNSNVVPLSMTVHAVAEGSSSLQLTRIAHGKSDPWLDVDKAWVGREYAELIFNSYLSAESDVRHVARALVMLTCPRNFYSAQDGEYFLKCLTQLTQVCDDGEAGDYICLRPYLQEVWRCLWSKRVNTHALHSLKVKDFSMKYCTRDIQTWRRRCLSDGESRAAARVALENLHRFKLHRGPDIWGQWHCFQEAYLYYEL